MFSISFLASVVFLLDLNELECELWHSWKSTHSARRFSRSIGQMFPFMEISGK